MVQQLALPFTVALLVLCISFNGFEAAPAPQQSSSSSSPPRKPPACSLGKDLLNSLVNAKNKDHEEYGVENTFGLVGDQPVELGDLLHDDISDQELQNCLEHYHLQGKSQNTSGDNEITISAPSADQQPYNTRPSHLPGGKELIAIPIPIPEDEDYLPGEDGYTTYINPHNYKQQGYIETDQKENTNGESKKKKKKKKKKNKKKKYEKEMSDEMLLEILQLLTEMYNE